MCVVRTYICVCVVRIYRCVNCTQPKCAPCRPRITRRRNDSRARSNNSNRYRTRVMSFWFQTSSTHLSYFRIWCASLIPLHAPTSLRPFSAHPSNFFPFAPSFISHLSNPHPHLSNLSISLFVSAPRHPPPSPPRYTQVGAQVAALEVQKQAAVAAEDYDRAKSIKDEIDRLRGVNQPPKPQSQVCVCVCRIPALGLMTSQ